MPEVTILLLGVLVSVLSLVVVILVVYTSRKSLHEARESQAAERTQRDRRISALEEEKEFLRSLDSIRFTERYFATRAAIDDRARRLESEADARRRRLEDVRRQTASLIAQGPGTASEVNQLRSRLARALEEAQRLERIVSQVSEIGPIQIDAIRSELAERRKMAAQLKGRLDYLSMGEEARTAEVEQLRREEATLRSDEGKLRRELEVTRSLAPAVDALLGVSSDMRRQISRVEDRLEGSVGGLIQRRLAGDPLADFLRAIRGELSDEPDRLLPGSGRAEARPVGPVVAEPPRNGQPKEDRAARDDRSAGDATPEDAAPGPRAIEVSPEI